MPDLIYAKGVRDTPNPGKTNFDKKLYTLILIEIMFSRDLGCDKKKHAEKTEKYFSFVAALKKYRGMVEFVANPAPSDTRRVQRSQGPSTTSLPPSPLFTHKRTTPRPTRAQRTPLRTPTPLATTTACSSRCWVRLPP